MTELSAIRVEREQQAPARAAGDRFAVGVDVGGTKLAVGLVDEAGHVFSRLVAPTLAGHGGQDVMRRLLDLVDELLRGVPASVSAAGSGSMRIVGIGVGTAGEVDAETGSVLYANENLPGWTGMPIRQLMEERFQLPTQVDNDGNAAALGEKLYGAGRDVPDVVCMTVGTGIGGGIVHAGRILRGARNSAGSLGHITVEPNGRRCACGRAGCLEAYASGPALSRRVEESIRVGEPSSLAAKIEEGLTGADVVQAAAAGDALAGRYFAEMAEYLGAACAIVGNLLNPHRILIGGGVADAGDLLFAPVRESFERRALPEVVRSTLIRPAQLGSEAGLVGAAGLVWTAA